jgi:hypothetical protein
MNLLSRAWQIAWSIGLAGAAVAAPVALAQDFGEWRALTVEEQKAHLGDVPAGSAAPLMIEADFNGDGRKDKALIAIRKADQVHDLIVDLGDQTHVLVRSEEGGEGIAPGASLGHAKPGRWETICGNAFRDLQGGLCESEKYPRAVRLEHPGIICIADGETLLYFWDRKKKTFDAVALRN